MSGVYLDMFEQSLLIDNTGTRKTATFAASFTAQILATGVLLVAPLLYHEVLPALRVPEIAPVLAFWHPPKPPVIEPRPVARSSGLAAPGVFRPPSVVHSDYPQASIIIVDLDEPVIAAAPAIGSLPAGAASSLPRFDGPTAPDKPQIVKFPESPVRVGGNLQSAKLIKQVLPVYPPLARQLRISDTVRLIGIIAKDGTIQRLQVLSGHPTLRKAALDAVSQWVYQPTFLNGQAVEVEAPVDVVFTLQ